MAKRKVPSQAASGAETFNDFLVGRQITDGTSALTNTVFALDKSIPQKDSKSFRQNPFSDFLTLDTIKEEDAPTTTGTSTKNKKRSDTIKFKGNKKYADKSLFGSLKSRILVSITRIINKFPAGVNVVANSPISSTIYSAINSSYDSTVNKTTFYVERSKIFNPFDINFVEPNSVIKPETDNEVRNFYSSFTKYVLSVNKTVYPILEYTEPDTLNQIKLVVYGNPFSGSTTYENDLLIRPNDGIVEEFFDNLDDLEQSLLNRETSPIYTSSFLVPKDSDDGNKTSLVNVQYNWPLSSDGWNIQINGIDYESYVRNLSDVSDEIDDYKSNLMVRFLASPQLFEFDTPDQRAESVFQLYGQSFDSVKKYIDNIAHMRNVSYDGIENLPDILLKNLAENLGLSSVNLFDQKSLDEILYTRLDSNYNGVSTGTNLVDAEFDFYRRLLVNLSYIYKSKGTRSSIDFFLKFLGAPEPLIKIDEYVYKVTSIPSSFNLEKDIYDVIQGTKVYSYADFDTTGFTYNTISYTASTTFTREGYPVDETTGLPRRALNNTDGIFFGAGAGWYDNTLSHRSPLVLDTENSVLTGKTKTIKTKNKPYTYGEDYFDVFRTLPGLDTGYNLVPGVDNDKRHHVQDDSLLTLNRKNIGVYISPANGVNYDIYRKSRELELSFGSNTLYPQTGKTFAEFLDTFIHGLVTNSNKIRYKKNYIQLEDVFTDYLSQTGFTPYHQIDVTEFINKVSPYWPQLVEQLLPSTTQWTGGNLIENNVFGRPKYQYRFGCQPLQFVESLYPNFETVIEEDLETMIGEEPNFRSLITISGVTYYPLIEIDGVIYGGPDYSGFTNDMCVVVSGTSNTTNSAQLFNPFPITGCTSVVSSNDPINLALICDYKDYLEPDVVKIKELWLNALSSLISSMTITRFSAGYEDYAPFTGTTGQTYYIETVPLVNYETFIDIDGVEKIRFSSIKYSMNDCSVSDYFDYRFEADYNINKNSGIISVEVTGTGEYICETPTGCSFVSDIYIEVIGEKTSVQNYSDRSFFMYANCVSGYNQNADYYIEKIPGNDCKFKLTGVTNNDVIDFNIIDASNKEVKFRIEGLQPQIANDPCPESGKTHTEIFEIFGVQGSTTISAQTGATYCDNYTGYTLVPKVEYKSNFDYGLKYDTKVLVVNSGLTINSGTTKDDIISYISGGTITEKNVYDLVVDEYVLSAEYLPCSSYDFQDILDATSSGFSFTYQYVKLKITDIDCLASVKKSLITGQTMNGNYEVFEVLPTTQLRVYTNRIVEDFGIPTNGIYFFDDRFPEELQKKPVNFIEPCCGHPKELYNHGDYLINQYGYPIEVIDVDLNYCEPNLYFNINFSKDGVDLNNEFVVIFNGNSDEQLLLKHQYNKHPNINFDLGQYYIDPVNCPTEPTNTELEESPFGCP